LAALIGRPSEVDKLRSLVAVRRVLTTWPQRRPPPAASRTRRRAHAL